MQSEQSQFGWGAARIGGGLTGKDCHILSKYTPMESRPNPDRVIEFGPFAVNIETGIVRKHGVRIKLQEQPFQILLALLETPGAVITRDELQRRLWPDNTFVDFEHGLNTAVNRLRLALGDTVNQPKYLETLTKRGYRFIGVLKSNASAALTQLPPEPTPERAEAPKKPTRLILFTVAAFFSVIIAAAAAYIGASRRRVVLSRPVPLTMFHGSEVDPALSPDGSYVAFAWDGEQQNNFDIYTLAIASGSVRRLTRHLAHDLAPAWSPDGRAIAFLRRAGDDRATLVTVPSNGGAEHPIAETRNDEMRGIPRLDSLSWSPDGRRIAASHHEPGEPHEGIYLFSTDGEQRRLTTSPMDSHGDHAPAFSHDGRKLAFCRLLGFSNSEVYLLSLDAGQQATDEVRLTRHKRWSSSPVWSPGGEEILYLFSQSGNPPIHREIRMISASGTPASDRALPLEDEVWGMSASSQLIYSRHRDDTNVWRASIAAPGEPPGVPELLISTAFTDGKARYSPDGSKISFVSSRSGSEELWVANADGSHPIRLTSFNQAVVGPAAWSPDGQSLVFHARPEGQADLFVMSAAGGAPRRLTHHPSDDNVPTYSCDGRSINFSSVRTGRRQIWRMSGAGGDAVQITTGGGMRPIESPDCKTLYYVSDLGNAIRRVPVSGGIETEVAAPVCPEFGFALTGEGLYFPAPASSGGACEFRLLSFATGQSRPVTQKTALPLGRTVNVSPDGKYLLFEQSEKTGMDLMLVKEFRTR
jgi:Tol biopolymer transport system component/DNA-binding winged helix-turn-helix (wHTH) protein